MKPSDLAQKEHSAYPILLNNSACVILKKLARHGTFHDIEDGSDRLQQALDGESIPESYKPTVISNQALFAAERYTRTEKMNDLQESIELAEKALTLVPVDYHDRRRHLY
jgi:GTP-sensing pleiotropic transcriptional regulator CodY